jgi:hypothetical protein
MRGARDSLVHTQTATLGENQWSKNQQHICHTPSPSRKVQERGAGTQQQRINTRAKQVRPKVTMDTYLDLHTNTSQKYVDA